MNGGYTMVISLPGSLRPGSLVTPENIKADVYLPQYLINELPQIKPLTATLIQTFIETIGVEVCARWFRAATNHWDIQSGENITGRGLPVVFPNSPTHSCFYEFWGHPPGELEQLIAAEQGTGRHTDQCTSDSTVPDPETVRLTEELQRLREENARLRALHELNTAEIAALRAAEQQRAEEGMLSVFSAYLWLMTSRKCASRSIRSLPLLTRGGFRLLVLHPHPRCQRPWAAPLRRVVRAQRHALRDPTIPVSLASTRAPRQ